MDQWNAVYYLTIMVDCINVAKAIERLEDDFLNPSIRGRNPIEINEKLFLKVMANQAACAVARFNSNRKYPWYL